MADQEKNGPDKDVASAETTADSSSSKSKPSKSWPKDPGSITTFIPSTIPPNNGQYDLSGFNRADFVHPAITSLNSFSQQASLNNEDTYKSADLKGPIGSTSPASFMGHQDVRPEVEQLSESFGHWMFTNHQPNVGTSSPGPLHKMSANMHSDPNYQQSSQSANYKAKTLRNIPPPIATNRQLQKNIAGNGASSAATLEGVQFLWQRRILDSSGPKTASVTKPGAFSFSMLTPMPPVSTGPLSANAIHDRSDYGLFSGGLAPIPLPMNRDSPTTDIFSPLTPAFSVRNNATSEPITVEFPLRPVHGIKGRNVQVRANFFECISLPGQDIYHYEIKITPEVPSSLNRKIFQEFQNQYASENMNSLLAVYDGRKNLYSPREINLQMDGSLDVNITLKDDNASSSDKNSKHRRFNVRIKQASIIDMKNLHTFLKGEPSRTPYEALQAIDVILRQKPSMFLTTVGRSFFTRNDAKVLGDGAECWMGFHQSVRPTQGKLLVNVDISATAFYEPGQILNFIARNLGRRTPMELKSPLRSRDIDKCERMLKGVKIAVTHRGEMRRKYKINGFTRTPADETIFKLGTASSHGISEERDISVASYFHDQYNYQLRFPHLPCLKVGSIQRAVYLPLEVCDIIPGQRYLRKLNEQQTAQMIRLTCQTPEKRALKIASAMNELGHTLENVSESSLLTEFGVQLSNDMISVPARILDPPTIQYHPTSREPLITPREGSWNLRDKKVVQPATLCSWSVICFGSPRDMPQQKIDHFLRELIMTCRDTGLHISNPHPPAIYADPMGNVESSLHTAWQAAGEAVQSYPQLVLCVLPNTAVPLYAEIKRIGDTILGIATQCVQVKHTLQPKKQYCANVCLKINAKLGGTNSLIVRNPSVPGDNGLPWLANEPTMIFGADITQPGHGEVRTTGSVCALVGSLDKLASRYTATVRIQPPRKEIISDLTSMVAELLTIFYQENNQVAPRRILFYRDGCSENYFAEIVTAELEAIRQACNMLQSDYRPSITFVAVQKRHHVKDADRSGNIPAGTVIDSHITHPTEYDFYLCSHAGLQGTSRPTHYHVLHDENGFEPDILQELTYRLCYSYARCTKSVSVVPPAYYADLVAFRAKYHMRSSAGVGASRYPLREDYTSGSLDQRTVSSVDEPSHAGSDAGAESSGELSHTSVAKKKKREEDEVCIRSLQEKLTTVKPELQRVMYFM